MRGLVGTLPGAGLGLYTGTAWAYGYVRLRSRSPASLPGHTRFLLWGTDNYSGSCVCILVIHGLIGLLHEVELGLLWGCGESVVRGYIIKESLALILNRSFAVGHMS